MSGGFLGKLWNISGTVPVSVFIVNSFFLLKPQDPPPHSNGQASQTTLYFVFPLEPIKAENLTCMFCSRSAPLDEGEP